MSATYVWHGVDIQEQPVKFERGLQGYTVTYTWIGKEGPINAKYNEMLDLGFKCNVDNVGGPAWQLTATGIIEIDLRYEIIYEKGQKSILDSKLPLVQTLSLANKSALNRFHNAPDKYTPPAFTGSATEITQAAQVYSLINAGVQNVIEFFPTVRMSYIAMNTDNVINNMTNNGRVLKTSTLITQIQAPANTIVPLMPIDGPYNSYWPLAPGSVNVPLNYGWLQMGPTVEQTMIAKVTIQQEWQFGLWSPWMYGNPI